MTISDFIKQLTNLQKQLGTGVQVKLAKRRLPDGSFEELENYLDIFTGLTGRVPEITIVITPSQRWGTPKRG